MTNYLKLMFLTGAVSACGFVACDKDKEIQGPTLYDRLGGISGISSIVDQFITHIISDNAINDRFAATFSNPSRARLLRLNLIDQICAGAGGPCTYKGLNMREAHKNMKISQAEFDAMIGNLVAALDQAGIPEKEKNELMEILVPMQAEIVVQ